MRWILLLPVAGLLFLCFAVADWALYRLEQNEPHQSRFKSFGVAGLALLLTWGGIAYWPATRAPQPALTLAAPVVLPELSTLEALRAPVAPSLALVATISERTKPPSLSQAREERAQILAARQSLAALPMGDDATVRIRFQIDTLLSVAYQAIGMQWRYTKEGDTLAQAQEEAMGLLRRESERWAEMEGCLEKGQTDCLKPPDHSERAIALRAWQHVMKPYFLDTMRFYEVDPDLAALTVIERRALRQHLAEGRSRLSQTPMPAWGAQVAAVAHELLLAADQALMREEIATTQGYWNGQLMATIYQPVQNAWDQMMNQALCALNEESTCRVNFL